MIVLAVETSGVEASLALADEDGLIVERRLTASGRRHAQALVADADAVLREQGLTPSRIGAVGVSIGPGSFTGLRVGVVFAKTLAWVNGVPLIAVDTLRAIAHRQPPSADPVQVVVEAQRSELFVGEYVFQPELRIWSRTGEIRILRPDQLTSAFAVTGPGLVRFAALLSGFRLADEALWQPRASDVARLTLWQLARGETAVPHALEPLYIRRSYAEE